MASLGHIYKTENAGENWFGDILDIHQLYSLNKMYALGTDTIYAAGRVLVRTTNGGESWELVGDYQDDFLDENQSNRGIENIIGFRMFDENNGQFFTNYEFYETTDGGKTITKKSNFVDVNFNYVYFFGESIYITSGGRGGPKLQIYKSNDNGRRWAVLEIEKDKIGSMGYRGITGIGEDTVYVLGLDGNLFETVDGGNSWSTSVIDSTTSLNTINVTEDNTLYVTTAHGYIFRNDEFSTTTGTERINKEVPKAFSLQQNYPNPFNPSTNIPFVLRKASHVNLKIYNVMGKEVAELVNKVLSEGEHEIVFWSDNSLPSGVYFYELSVDSFSERKSMLLIK